MSEPGLLTSAEVAALAPAWTPWSASDSPDDRAYRTEQDDHVLGDDRPAWSSDDDEHRGETA